MGADGVSAPALAPAEPVGAGAVDHDVGVVGAGFGGLIAGIALLDAGRPDFAIFERGAELGGVWRDNVYPGCACDVRSHLYSIAARPEPDWKTTYGRRADILAYLKRVAAEGGLNERIRLGFDVVEALWLADARCWRLTSAAGDVVRVRSLILAVGPLNRPRLPDVAGIARFAGLTMHSSAWDPAFDPRGKRVAVIGAGASAVQIVPNIAPDVDRLVVFQRSAAWVLPRGDRPTSALERFLFRRVPGARALVRQGLFWLMEGVGSAFFGRAWVHRLLTRVALHKLKHEVKDPAVRAALTPDYALGCKRMVVSDDYLPAFNRDNVELVKSAVAAIEPTGVRTADGRLHPVDALVFATGFYVADPDGFLRVVGEGGRVLADDWARDGATAHRGVTVTGYPNLAMLLGPNSGLSYSSVLHVIESQMTYVLAWLAARDAAGPRAALDVRADAQAAYNAEVQAALAGSIWASGCRSWYLDRHGRNGVIAPDPAARYRRKMKRFDAEAYRVGRAP
jgi:cation diffusion facilitator CzcD-associated flavoprotein CzcO